MLNEFLFASVNSVLYVAWFVFFSKLNYLNGKLKNNEKKKKINKKILFQAKRKKITKIFLTIVCKTKFPKTKTKKEKLKSEQQAH